MENIFLVLIGSALVNNIVVGHMIGVDPSFASARRHDAACGLSVVMLILLPVTTVIASATTQFILVPLQLQHLQTLVFVLLIITTACGLGTWSNPVFKHRMDVLLPLAGVNATVLGTLLLNRQHDYHLFHSFVFGLGTAIGFTLMLALLTAINTRVEMADIPAPFKGSPITLITLGLISMALLGLAGLAQ